MTTPGESHAERIAPQHTASPSYLLVMTATILPAANAGVRRADPQLRLEDYKRALRYWLNYEHSAADRILLLENSGADLSANWRLSPPTKIHATSQSRSSLYPATKSPQAATTATPRCKCSTKVWQ